MPEMGLMNAMRVEGVQVVAEADKPEYMDLAAWKPGTLQRLLVLERLQDPGNLVGPRPSLTDVCCFLQTGNIVYPVECIRPERKSGLLTLI